MSSIANTGEMTILEIEQLNNSLKYGQKFGIAQRLMAIQYTQVGATITQILRLEDDEYLKFGTGSDESAPATDWDIRAYFDGTNLLWVGNTERIGKVIYDNVELNIGEFSSTTAGAGLPMDEHSAAFRVYTDDDGVSMTGSRRGILSRMLYTIDQTTGETYRALHGQLKIVNDVDLDHENNVISCVEGYMEWDGTADHTIDGHVACVRAALEEGSSGTTTIDATGFLIGFEATLDSSRTYTVNGVMAAFSANIDEGASEWPVGFYAGCDDVDQIIVIPGGVSGYAGSAGTVFQAGSFGSEVQMNTAGMRGFACYFSSTATSGTITGMRLRTRSNAASGTQFTLSLLCQADVLAGKFSQDCIAADFQSIAKLGATLASNGWFVGAQFKVEDEEATGTPGDNITYGGYVATLRLMSQISANPTLEYCMVFMDAQEAVQGAVQDLDSWFSIANSGRNLTAKALFHWLGVASMQSSGNYAVVLGDGAANQSAWTSSNEKGYLTINIDGTSYQIPFFQSS